MPITKSTWHNRYIGSSHGTWSIARDGRDHALSCGYQRASSLLAVGTSLIATYNIYRAWLNFNTQDITSVTAVRMGIYVTAKVGVTNAIYITKGLVREPIDENDWATQTGEVTNLGQFNLADLVLNQYNWAELNAAGIAWINQSVLELKQGESSDCERTFGFAIFAPYRCSQTRFPQSAATITTLKLRLRRVGSPGTFYVDIYAADANHKPTGSILASGSINGNTLTTVTWGLWYQIDLGAGFTPTIGQEYCTVGYILAGDASKYVNWIGATAGKYANGYLSTSSDGGGTWVAYNTHSLSTIDYEAVSVGGTNFCLRTNLDVNNSPPGSGQEYSVAFYSAQKGEGYLPILEFYETFPTANLTRVTAIRHIYRPGLFRMEVTLGDVQNAIDMIDTKVRKEVGEPAPPGAWGYYPPEVPYTPRPRYQPPYYYTPEVPEPYPKYPQYAPEAPQPSPGYVPYTPPSFLDIFKERMWSFMKDPLAQIQETWGKIKWW